MHARAFTQGQNIYFGEGQSSFNTLAGQRLLAHELTHTLQQTRPAATPYPVQRQAQSREELQKRLAAVQKELSVGSGVRAPEAIEQLKQEEESLQAALRQVSVTEIQQKLEANKKQQATGSGVRSNEASTKLKEEGQELAMRLAIASGSSTAGRKYHPARSRAALHQLARGKPPRPIRRGWRTGAALPRGNSSS